MRENEKKEIVRNIYICYKSNFPTEENIYIYIIYVSVLIVLHNAIWIENVLDFPTNFKYEVEVLYENYTDDNTMK